MSERRSVIVEAQGQLLRVRVPGMPVFNDNGGGARGEVTGFSAGSRKRMLERLARIDKRRVGVMAFATLTYPDRDGPPGVDGTERDRQTFLKRIARAFPVASGMWRREHEKRKSGAFEGVPFPHYHFLFFGLPFFPYQELNRIWREVIDYEEYVRTEIRAVRSMRQAFAYVAKYMAKEEDGAGAGGRAGPEPGPAGERGSLVYGAYLTAKCGEPASASEEPRSVGRAWGVANRKLLPLGEQRVLRVPDGPWLGKGRDRARIEYPGIPPDSEVGFTLFVDNPEEWLQAFAELQALLELGVVPDDGLDRLTAFGLLPWGVRPEQRN